MVWFRLKAQHHLHRMCRKLVEYGPVVLVLILLVCLFLGVLSWMSQTSEISEERIQELAAERLRRMGLDL